MTKVKISVCQMKVRPLQSFQEFAAQVHAMMEQVPADSHYILFSELFTMGLMSSFAESETFSDKDVVRISKYTEDFTSLFQDLAARRSQVIIAGSHLEHRAGRYLNTSYIFKEDGSYAMHSKTHVFPAEAAWGFAEGQSLELFEFGPAKFGVLICYEAEIPELSRILAVKGADIIFCPSSTLSEHGFWRVRHSAQARAVENQVYFVNCTNVGGSGFMADGYGRSSILSPCEDPWNPDGIVAEAVTNENDVITGEVDIGVLHAKRDSGAATTFKDRNRRSDFYRQYAPYHS